MYELAKFFFNHTATTEIYTLSLHDALPIYHLSTGRLLQPTHDRGQHPAHDLGHAVLVRVDAVGLHQPGLQNDAVQEERRSEEHTSELQSRLHLVCRLLLEKKKSCTQSHVQP